MPQRKSSTAPVASGVSAKQFCWACICFLGTVLVVQVCVLASLLRRLAEVHRLAEPAASQTATAAEALASVTGSADAPALRPRPADAGAQAQQNLLRSSEAGASNKAGLAIAAAVGAGAEAILIFVASFLRAAPSASLVLLVDQTPVRAQLEDNGVDLQRVTFERVALPLPLPWDKLAWSDANVWLFHNYLQQRVPEASQLLQLSSVDDVAFQADPFLWASGQQPGLHLFADEPTQTVGSEKKLWRVMELCYGDEAALPVQPQPSIPPGYLIGSAADVQRYIGQVVNDMVVRSECLSQRGVSGAVSNFIAHGVHSGISLHLHENRRGPVWTGGHVPKKSILADSEDHLINEDGFKYAVLHQYDQHEDLWRSLLKRFKKNRQPSANLGCAAFQIQSGDMRGYDLTHTPADTELDCCLACLGDTGCGAFIFSPSRSHCWLKVAGGTRTVASPGDDLHCGVRNVQPGPGPGGGPGVI